MPRESEAIVFDQDVLKRRGISGDVANYFKQQARFTAGVNRVALYVNDQYKGTVRATFDSRGALCFDARLLDHAGLRRDKGAAGCGDFLQRYPNTMVDLRPGREEVRLIVPTDALRPAGIGAGNYATGGTAAILNYDALAVGRRFQGQSSQFQYQQTEAGVNAGDWILRSRQSYFKSDSHSRVEHLYAYGQKTFVGLGSTFQAGQVNLANSIFPGDRITGVQITPEAALRRGLRSSKTLVNGIANAPARIEVRQSGALIYSTLVPQGPFGLADIPLLNQSSDLEVTVIENGGAPRTFIVPAADLAGCTLGGVPGHSFAVGQYRPYGGALSEKPLLATGTGAWSLNDKLNLTGGVMAASSYYAGGWAVDRVLTSTTTASLRQLLSHAQEAHVTGTRLSLSLNSQITPRLSTSFGASRRTPGFRDLADTVAKHTDAGEFSARHESQYMGLLGWTDNTVGSLRASYSRSTTSKGCQVQRITGSWSKAFRHATLALNLQRTGGAAGKPGGGSAASLSIAIPLGKSSVRTYVDRTDAGTRTGANLSGQVNDYVGYSVSADHDGNRREANMSGNLNMLPRYVQTNLGYARSGSVSSMYSGQLRGAVAIHKDGATLSPYPISDTFGISKVGDAAGVRISTPQGPVWTDAGGRAVVPQLTPYGTSRLEVSTKSLPRNVDLANGYREVQAGRGAVRYVDFDVISNRRVLLNAKTNEGAPLPKGAAVTNEKGEFITTVLDRGKIFLANANANANGGGSLHVDIPGAGPCELSFPLADKQDLSSYYETADAVCHKRPRA